MADVKVTVSSKHGVGSTTISAIITKALIEHGMIVETAEDPDGVEYLARTMVNLQPRIDTLNKKGLSVSITQQNIYANKNSP